MKKLITLISTLAISTAVMAEVEVHQPYARAVPPGQPNSAAFMMLKNSATDEVALTSASSSVAKAVELHTHTHADGVMKMRKVENIPVAGKKMVELKPGGYHVMLIGLNQNMVKGETIDLQLNFSDGSSQQLDVEVKDVMSGMQMKKHNH